MIPLVLFILLMLPLVSWWIRVILEPDEKELKEIYKIDVLACHPGPGPVPITYEEWKHLRNK